jgi:hypothetical protein
MAGEPTFPILYQVQAALGKSNLFLPPRMLTKNAFFTPLQVSTVTLTLDLFSFYSGSLCPWPLLLKRDPQRDSKL